MHIAKAELPNYAGSAKQIAFIVGTGRCGTTILAKVLNSHSKICVPHELQFLIILYDKYSLSELKNYRADDFIRLINECCPYYFENFFDYIQHFKNLQYPQTDLRKVLTDLFDHVCFKYKKEIFMEQTPWYGQKLDILKEIFPEMKVIHMIRDGRDVAVSFSRTPWWSKNIDENIERWGQEIHTIHNFGIKNMAKYLAVRYEDLVLNTTYELNKILNFLNVPFESEMLSLDNLIDYFSLFKGGETSQYQSSEFNRWIGNKDKIFFRENTYAWKKNDKLKSLNLTKEVKDTLNLFNYEI